MFQSIEKGKRLSAQSRRPLHPLVATAAVAIMLVCLTALASMTGVLSSTQGALAAAYAATPVEVPTAPARAGSTSTPGSIAGATKRLPALSAADSLGPGEALIDIDVKPTVAKPTSAVPSRAALLNQAPSTQAPPKQKPSKQAPSTVVSKVPASARIPPTTLPAPQPRIIPVYRDMDRIFATTDDDDSGDYVDERTIPPATGR
ncbi:MAG: hypothetical protein V4695_01325 [Pseudomonadota bacterium]